MDETSHWISSNDGHEMAAVIARNQAKSNQGSSRALELANAHLPGEDSVAERTFEAWRKANGRVPGLLYDSLEAAPIEDLADEEAVRAGLLAARGDATWLDVDRLLAEIQDPATAEHISRRFYLNQVVRVEGERWMRMDVWDACARPDYVIPERAEVVLGFDGSRTGDSTALVAVSVVTAEEVPHLEVVRLFENTSDDPGWEVDMEAVMDDVRAACRRWRVREIAADLTYWQLPMRILESERLPVVEMPQSLQRMGPATTAFQQAVYNGRLTQSGDPDLRRHVSNAVLVVSSRGDKLAKDSQHSPRRIDLAVAAVMALSRAGSAKKRHVGMFMTQPDGSQVDVVARAREQAATREHERQAEPEPQPPRGSVFA
jgi:hypothetical protein